MTDELKTLKDLQIILPNSLYYSPERNKELKDSPEFPIVPLNELKQEAIKNYINAPKGILKDWIEWFFNLTEEDLK